MRRMVLKERWYEIPPRMAYLAGPQGRITDIISIESAKTGESLLFEAQKSGTAMFLVLGDRTFQLTDITQVNPGDDVTVRLKWRG